MRMGMALNCARFQWPRALFYRPQSFAKVLALVSQTQKTLRRYTTANATSISANPNSITPPPPTPTIPASALSFGQPIHETHPHLIGPGDLTRNISASEYHLRRTRLASLLPRGSVAIFSSAQLQYRAGVVFHEFHQNTDFLYLTGWCEPSPAIGVLEALDGGSDYRWTMFVTPERDEWDTQWNGPVNGVVAAKDVWNADEAYRIQEVDEQLSKILSRSTGSRDVYATKSSKSTVLLKNLSHHLSGVVVHDLSAKIAELRAVKSSSEIRNMRLAGKFSGRGFSRAMGRLWKTEASLWAYLAWAFKSAGCEKEAYVPVVAGGKNACTIHYTRNDEELRPGDLVLVDAAGQYSHYPSDITRTWPVSGTFSPAQRNLYSAVLNVQRYAITLVHPGITFHDISGLVLQTFLRELRNLGPGFSVSKELLTSVLFPHSTGHHIGLDIHDVSTHMGRPLVPGNVITIEPGIYVPPGDDRWPKELWGVGIRIEDVVAVQELGEPGPLVLSTEAVKEVVDIEALGLKAREREERIKARGIQEDVDEVDED